MALKDILVGIAIIGAMAGIGYVTKKRITEIREYSERVENPAGIENYVVNRGETFWDIASKNRPKDIPIGAYIFKMKEYNPNVKNYTIHPGDTLKIPIYDKK